MQEQTVGVSVSRPGVVVTALKQKSKGRVTLLQLWELAGESATPFRIARAHRRIRDLYSSGLEIEHYPCRRMVAGVHLPTRPSVYTTIHEPI